MAHLTTRSSVWRAHDRRTASGTPGHALLNLKSGRRARKAAARSRFDRVDEPDAQRASRGRYLRVRHQTEEQAQEGDQYDKRLYSTAIANPCTRACQIFPPPRSLAPFDVRNLRPLGLLNTTAIPLRSPRTSDPGALRRPRSHRRTSAERRTSQHEDERAPSSLTDARPRR